MKRFPENFYIGAATAAHQVEGNNIHSDYWAMEHMKHTSFNEPSLDAVDHYRRYEEDIRLLAEAGLNTYRFSVEWARIEPKKGQFDENEVKHYRDVLQCCKKYGVTPIVTMLHFTSPVWVIANGGWENEATVDDFANYCAYVVTKLGDLMDYVVTINEANMGIQIAAIAERYKRQMLEKKKSKAKEEKTADAQESLEGTAQVGMNFSAMLKNMFWAGFENKKIFGTRKPQVFVSARTQKGDELVMQAHLAAKKAMKAVKPSLKIGLSLSLHDIQALPGGEELAAKEWEQEFTHYLPYLMEDDFFGLQNYTRSLIDENGICPVPKGAQTTQMDYEYYPQALAHVITRAHAEFKKAGREDMPIMVTENGVATADDGMRIAFIEEATRGVLQCLEKGIPVIGYCYWSLMDNFEWQKGFSMTFGLIAVDRKTMERQPKESLYYLGEL